MAHDWERGNKLFAYLRRLRAGGRSNMYGAIPYLVSAFGIDRETAFRAICEWLDRQSGDGQSSPPAGVAPPHEPAAHRPVAHRPVR